MNACNAPVKLNSSGLLPRSTAAWKPSSPRTTLVGQQMHPHLLAQHLRRLTTQHVNLQRWLDRTQDQFGVPTRQIQIRQILVTNRLRGQERRRHQQNYRAA